MIIWRGWGILGLFVTLAGVFGTLAVVHALLGTSESASALGGGIGFLLAGVANFFLGRWLNIIRPAQNAEDFRNQLRADLWERVANDAFQMAPGAPEPSSEAEAAQQIEQVVAGESRNAERAGRNIHTFFFIPPSVAWCARVHRRSRVLLLLALRRLSSPHGRDSSKGAALR